MSSKGVAHTATRNPQPATTNQQLRGNSVCFKLEGIEVGVAVVIVLVFGAFQESHDLVGERRHYDLPGGLQQIVDDDDGDDLLSGPHTQEGQRIENDRINEFAG